MPTRRIGSGVLVLLLTLGCRGLGQSPPKTETGQRPATFKGSGCVRKGVEDDCLVLTDPKTRKTFSLFFGSGKKPAVNTAISFSGHAGGPNICQQGTPVDVDKWTSLRMRCPAETSDRGLGREILNLDPDLQVPPPHGEVREDVHKYCSGTVASAGDGPNLCGAKQCQEEYPKGKKVYWECEEGKCPVDTEHSFPVSCKFGERDRLARGCLVTFSEVTACQ